MEPKIYFRFVIMDVQEIGGATVNSPFSLLLLAGSEISDAAVVHFGQAIRIGQQWHTKMMANALEASALSQIKLF